MNADPSLPGSGEARAARFAAALFAIEAELDWAELGRAYCWDAEPGAAGDGAEFFGEQDREAIRDCGLRFAGDLAEELSPATAKGAGRSVYVGAALAELAPMLCETIVLGRRVDAFALDGPETRALNRALAASEAGLGCPLPRIRTDGLAQLPVGAADHGWLVSVLSDPEGFPALHDRLYEREGSELATGRGNLADDERRAHELLDALLRSLTPDAHLHTTDEELPLVHLACQRRGSLLQVPEHARLSAIVGDPVRRCRLTSSPGPISSGR